MNQSGTGCVRVRGGSLPCPEVGRVSSSCANRSVTGCVPVPGSDLPGPGVCWVDRLYVHRFGWPHPGARVGVAVPDQVCPPPHRRLPGHWYILRHQLRSRSRPTRQANIHLSFRHRQPGHPRFPPHQPPRRAVPDSSSNFYSSGFWSNPTTTVGSATATQERRSKVTGTKL